MSATSIAKQSIMRNSSMLLSSQFTQALAYNNTYKIVSTTAINSTGIKIRQQPLLRSSIVCDANKGAAVNSGDSNKVEGNGAGVEGQAVNDDLNINANADASGGNSAQSSGVDKEHLAKFQQQMRSSVRRGQQEQGEEEEEPVDKKALHVCIFFFLWKAFSVSLWHRWLRKILKCMCILTV